MKIPILRSVFLASLFLLLAVAVLAAPPRLASILTDNAVLQRGVKAPVWGMAEPGEKVTVTLGGQKAETSADSQGRWIVKIGPLAAGGPFELTVTAPGGTATLRNVLIGEVWVCSGQSNMNWPLISSPGHAPDIAAANDPQLRLFNVRNAEAEQPLEETGGQWTPCTPETVAGFSAVAYFFGHNLREALGVPVGLIRSAEGGTPAEVWTRREALLADPEIKAVVEAWDRELPGFYPVREEWRAKNVQWQKDAEQAKAEGKPEPPRPPVPPQMSMKSLPWKAGCLYNGMIAPLIPYAIGGVIWYQGESNAYRSYHYRELLPAMIADWRRMWGQGDFAFLIVQLPNYKTPSYHGPSTSWPELREGQMIAAQKLPKTAAVVTIDQGDPNDIHPQDKREVGRRLALAARALAYGEAIEWSGPIYKSMTVKQDRAIVSFEHVDGGLVAKGGAPLKGFEIAGEDLRFQPAEAQIAGETVVVRSKDVAEPAAVRYAWADNPECNLENAACLPAAPFRTNQSPPANAEESLPASAGAQKN